MQAILFIILQNTMKFELFCQCKYRLLYQIQFNIAKKFKVKNQCWIERDRYMSSRQTLWWQNAELREHCRRAPSQSMMAARTASLLAGSGRPSRVAMATSKHYHNLCTTVAQQRSDSSHLAFLNLSPTFPKIIFKPQFLFDSLAPQLFSVAKLNSERSWFDPADWLNC